MSFLCVVKMSLLLSCVLVNEKKESAFCSSASIHSLLADSLMVWVILFLLTPVALIQCIMSLLPFIFDLLLSFAFLWIYASWASSSSLYKLLWNEVSLNLKTNLSKLVVGPIILFNVVLLKPRNGIRIVHPFKRLLGGLEVLHTPKTACYLFTYLYCR